MNLRDISFPLNVYAAMLAWSGIPLDYLHYGLYATPDEPTGPAQRRASDLLWAHMPAAPCRVLEVGIGLGTTLQRLQQSGYTALGITPDAAQAAIARERHGAAVQVQVCRLEDLPAPAQAFDLMLLQESAQYIEPLDLFEAADRLLAEEGATLLLMDEFALRREGEAHGGLHHFDHFVALAGRFGWQVDQMLDLGTQAAPTLDAIAAMVRQHRQCLVAELGVGPEQLDMLIASAGRYRALYDAGVYGYRLLRLRRQARPRLRLGAVTAAQAPAMRDLFSRSFGHEMDAATWHWKYGEGRGRALGLWQGDALVAHYAAFSRRVHLMGQPALACQVGDVMVSAEVKAGLDRQGPFHKVSASLLESQIGWGRPHAVGFGFPNSRAMRVAQRLGLYAPVDAVVALSWPALPAWPDAMQAEPLDLATLQEASLPWQELEQAWAAMAISFADSALGVRDPAWLRQRYGRRPHVPHQAVLLRSAADQHCRGAVVLRVHEHAVELLDVVGARDQLPALVRLARHQAHGLGRERLETWVTRSHRACLDDPADPATELPLDVTVPANAHSPGLSPLELQDRWFLMGGDTDFR